MNKDKLPILYTFRRCPYAMRARMGSLKGQTLCTIREVSLRDKPDEMVMVSPKGTVPVLLLSTGQVIEESLEIMLWALAENDKDDWLEPEYGTITEMFSLINKIDYEFKFHLDRYKYSTRYKNEDSFFHRGKALDYLLALNQNLERHLNLFGEKTSLADIAIFPFVRQFANANRDWFDGLDIEPLQSWFLRYLQAEIFLDVMEKYPKWIPGDEDILFP